MEAFEHVVKVAMETEGLVVAGNLKFPVARRTQKKARDETQTHGYEVDLVGARQQTLVLASVKSFFGSKGVTLRGVEGRRGDKRLGGFALLNDQVVQEGVITRAAEQFGYTTDHVELRLYVGKFKNDGERTAIEGHLARSPNGLRPVRVFGLDSIIRQLFAAVDKDKMYINDPVVATMRALTHFWRRVNAEALTEYFEGS
jgi:hypothetical protein